MDILMAIVLGLKIILGFINLLFVPGFVISLVYFPRFSDIGIVQRLAYSMVLSIGSIIALVLFMDVILGADVTPENISIIIAVFTVLMLLVWFCELWYLKSHVKKRLEPKISQNYQDLQRYYSREINTAKDRFRQDTRTKVVYHESEQSGMNHIDHSYLMDVGEEIDIQQIVENKLNVTHSVIVQPPYPQTRYFELAIREYKEDGLSLIDDLQLFPVLVTKDPDRKILNFVLQRGSLHITERIHKKTSTTEVQWIYSHDFHLFGITHADDTLDMMVDRIMGKLDEIAIARKSGVQVFSPLDEQQMLKEAFDVVMKKPRDSMVKPLQIPGRTEVPVGELWEISKPPEVQAGVAPEEIPKRPEIQPVVLTKEIPKRPEVMADYLQEVPERPEDQPGIQPEEIPKHPEVLAGFETRETTKHPVVLIGVQPEEIPSRPVFLTGIHQEEIPKHPEVPADVTPEEIPEHPGGVSKEIPKRPEIQAGTGLKEIPRYPEVPAGGVSKEIPKRPEIPAGVQSEEIHKRLEAQSSVVSREIHKRPEVQAGAGHWEIPKRPEGQHRVKPPEIISHPKVTLDVAPREIPKRPEGQTIIEPEVKDRRKLQKEILRDLDVFNITPNSFSKSKKNIEHILIPKKSDVDKKLAELEEDKDWLDLEWLYE